MGMWAFSLSSPAMDFRAMVWGVVVMAAVSGKVVDVTKYGAVGDGVTLNTAAIVRAVEVCASDGGCELLFPAKKVCRSMILPL